MYRLQAKTVAYADCQDALAAVEHRGTELTGQLAAVQLELASAQGAVAAAQHARVAEVSELNGQLAEARDSARYDTV
jgi:hypothetical protein